MLLSGWGHLQTHVPAGPLYIRCRRQANTQVWTSVYIHVAGDSLHDVNKQQSKSYACHVAHFILWMMVKSIRNANRKDRGNNRKAHSSLTPADLTSL